MHRLTAIAASEDPDGTFLLRRLGDTQVDRYDDIAALWAALDEIDAPHNPLAVRLITHVLAAGVRALRAAAGTMCRQVARAHSATNRRAQLRRQHTS